MMNEYVYTIALFVAGMLLGAIFFGGLWMTIKKSIGLKSPALWFIGSFILRTAIVLVGFYYLSKGNWKQSLVSLLGFITARMIIKRKVSYET